MELCLGKPKRLYRRRTCADLSATCKNTESLRCHPFAKEGHVPATIEWGSEDSFCRPTQVLASQWDFSIQLSICCKHTLLILTRFVQQGNLILTLFEALMQFPEEHFILQRGLKQSWIQTVITHRRVSPSQHFAPQMCSVWQHNRVHQKRKSHVPRRLPRGRARRRLIHLTTQHYPAWSFLYKSVFEMCLCHCFKTFCWR